MANLVLLAWAAWALLLVALYCAPLRWVVPSAIPTCGRWLVPRSERAAFCLRSHVVVTQGALDVLTARELGAILEHEDTHVRERHGLQLLAYRILLPLAPSKWLRDRCERRANASARLKWGADVLAAAHAKLS